MVRLIRPLLVATAGIAAVSVGASGCGDLTGAWGGSAVAELTEPSADRAIVVTLDAVPGLASGEEHDLLLRPWGPLLEVTFDAPVECRERSGPSPDLFPPSPDIRLATSDADSVDLGYHPPIDVDLLYQRRIDTLALDGAFSLGEWSDAASLPAGGVRERMARPPAQHVVLLLVRVLDAAGRHSPVAVYPVTPVSGTARLTDFMPATGSVADAFSAAVRSLGMEGGIVVIPSGDWPVQKSLQVRRGQLAIVGEPGARLVVDATERTLLNIGSVGGPLLEHVYVAGLEFFDPDPEGHAGPDEESHGVVMREVRDGRIDYSVFRRLGDEGVDIIRSSQVVARGNRFLGMPAVSSGGGALSANSSHSISLLDTYCSSIPLATDGAAGSCIRIEQTDDASPTFGIRIDGLTAADCAGDVIELVAGHRDIEDVEIRNITAEYCGGSTLHARTFSRTASGGGPTRIAGLRLRDVSVTGGGHAVGGRAALFGDGGVVDVRVADISVEGWCPSGVGGTAGHAVMFTRPTLERVRAGGPIVRLTFDDPSRVSPVASVKPDVSLMDLLAPNGTVWSAVEPCPVTWASTPLDHLTGSLKGQAECTLRNGPSRARILAKFHVRR